MKFGVELIAKRLRRLIREGYFRPGAALPIIHELSKLFGVSLVTVHSAIRRLRDEGLVETRRGQGVFVRQPLGWNTRGNRVALLSPFPREFHDERPYPAKTIAALRRALGKAGYELELVPLDEIGIAELSTHLQGMELAGLIIFEIQNGRLIEECRDVGLPLVSMDHDAYCSGAPSIVFDNLGGGFQGARYLIELGHERIVFVRQIGQGLRLRSLMMGSHIPIDTVSDQRMHGYRLAMQQAGLEAAFAEFRESSSKDFVGRLLAGRPAPTALFFLDEAAAAECAAAAGKLGYSVPDELSLVGFGGGRLAFAPGQKITSVWVDMIGLGRDAARLFVEAVRGEPLRRIILPTRLVECDSTAACPVDLAAKT